MSNASIDLTKTAVRTIDGTAAAPPRSRAATLLRAAETTYLAVITVAAAFVAYLGFVAPKRMDEAFTWADLPPLHARFVASLYLFGAVYVGACMVTRRRAQVGPVYGGIITFTGLLFTLTMLNLKAFDFDLAPVWVWTVSYIVYPILGVVLVVWIARSGQSGPQERVADRAVAPWARRSMQGIAATVGLTGLLLLVARDLMVDMWPWKVSTGLAQFYAAPVLAVAFCAWRYSTRTTWRSLRTITPALLVLGVATLASSLVHRALFDVSDVSDVVWFAGFGLLTLISAALCVGAFGRNPAEPEAQPLSRQPPM